MNHPMQPFEEFDGVIRFKRNKIVEHLVDHGGIDLNKIAAMDFTDEDRCQLAQLIGYSLCGYHELSYVSDTEALLASEKAREQFDDVTIKGCRDDGCQIHNDEFDRAAIRRLA